MFDRFDLPWDFGDEEIFEDKEQDDGRKNDDTALLERLTKKLKRLQTPLEQPSE